MASKTVVIPYHIWYNAYGSYVRDLGGEFCSGIKFDRACGLHFLAFIPAGEDDPGLEFRVCDRRRYTWAVLQYGL